MDKILENKKIIYLIFFFNQVCSIRFFLNSSFFNKDITFFYIYIFISLIIFHLIFSKKIMSFFLSDKIIYSIFIFFFFFLIYIYPQQDALKYSLLGSDQDNCYIDIINNVKNNNDIIYSKSYLGNPCSTGLLSFLFYFPLIFWENYFTAIPLIFLLLFKKCNLILLGDKILANFVTLLLLSNLVFLELAVSGSDFISISISYVVANIFFIEGLKNKKKLFIFISFIFFLFFFGSRSILLILILPLGYIYYNKFNDTKVLVYFFLLLILVSASFIIPYILLLPNFFPPFHLISKAYWYLSNIKYILLVLITILFVFRSFLIKFIKSKYLMFILLLILIPFLLSSVSGMIFHYSDLSKWEELNYIFLFTPALYIFILASFKFK